MVIDKGSIKFPLCGRARQEPEHGMFSTENFT